MWNHSTAGLDSHSSAPSADSFSLTSLSPLLGHMEPLRRRHGLADLRLERHETAADTETEIETETKIETNADTDTNTTILVVVKRLKRERGEKRGR